MEYPRAINSALICRYSVLDLRFIWCINLNEVYSFFGSVSNKSSVIIKNISERIEKLMVDRGRDGNELAAKLGVSPAALSNWRGGSGITGGNLRALARELNCDVEFLTGAQLEVLRPVIKEGPQSSVEHWMQRALRAEEKLTTIEAAMDGRRTESKDIRPPSDPVIYKQLDE